MQTVSGSRQAVHFAVTIRKNELIHVAKNDKIKIVFMWLKRVENCITEKKDD